VYLFGGKELNRKKTWVDGPALRLTSGTCRLCGYSENECAYNKQGFYCQHLPVCSGGRDALLTLACCKQRPGKRTNRFQVPGPQGCRQPDSGPHSGIGPRQEGASCLPLGEPTDVEILLEL
jgi:hypothetical protein